MPERLALCSGAKRAGGNSTLRLALSGHSQNVTLKLEDISKRLVKNVPDLLTDEVVLFSAGSTPSVELSRNSRLMESVLRWSVTAPRQRFMTIKSIS
jgi:hypothetical protein